jgi:hypothetical protein
MKQSFLIGLMFHVPSWKCGPWTIYDERRMILALPQSPEPDS